MMVVFMGIRRKALISMLLSGLAIIVFAWNWLHPYQQRRVKVLFDPEADRLGAGYQIIQSKIAVGSGGFWGKGYLQGTQTQLQFLPEHTTDFVFSVLAEEWGFVGCTVVLLLYLFLMYRLLRVVQRSHSLFAGLVTFGVAAYIFFHAMVNIGMVIGLLPVVGLPLPLFSAGGSSIISVLFLLGVVLGISMRRSVFVRS
jgi:rod shape determining protein RodA